MLTLERLKSEFSYDPETGVWTRTARSKNGKGVACARAGRHHKSGYREIKIDGIRHKEHRLAFLWMTGEFPANDVDHCNLNKCDNRWVNLRQATRSQNMANKARGATNSSGLKGVSWFKRTKKWWAQIKVDGRGKSLGLYDCPAAAHFAYVVASRKAFGDFSRAA
jgi:hypothetical protein